MNKLSSPLFIVEGKTDTEKLRKIGLFCTIITNGLSVSRETLNYLKAVIKVRPVIALLDPDKPGSKIFQKLQKVVPQIQKIDLDSAYCIKRGKLGLAEASDEYLISLLKPYIFENNNEDLQRYPLLLNRWNSLGNEEKDRVRKKYSLGTVNNKIAVKRLLYLGVEPEDI